MSELADPDPIAVYQQTVARLIKENKQLQHRLAELRGAHDQEMRELRAQLHEGLSPEVAVLTRQLATWKQRAQSAEQRLRQHLREA